MSSQMNLYHKVSLGIMIWRFWYKSALFLAPGTVMILIIPPVLGFKLTLTPNAIVGYVILVALAVFAISFFIASFDYQKAKRIHAIIAIGLILLTSIAIGVMSAFK